jgi:hypothetical protein
MLFITKTKEELQPMKKIFLLSVLAFASGIGCASMFGVQKQLTEGGKKVRTIKSDAPKNCQELGPVKANGNTEYATYGLRNMTAEKGGNVVRLEAVANSWMSGTAYKCP